MASAQASSYGIYYTNARLRAHNTNFRVDNHRITGTRSVHIFGSGVNKFNSTPPPTAVSNAALDPTTCQLLRSPPRQRTNCSTLRRKHVLKYVAVSNAGRGFLWLGSHHTSCRFFLQLSQRNTRTAVVLTCAYGDIHSSRAAGRAAGERENQYSFRSNRKARQASPKRGERRG